MDQYQVSKGRLDSWKAIAAYLGRDVRTTIRWEKHRGLPIHRIPGGHRNSVYAFQDEIDAWLRNKAPEDLEQQSLESAEPSGQASLPNQNGSETAASSTHVGVLNRSILFWSGIAAMSILLLASGAYSLRSLTRTRQFRPTDLVQLTSTETIKVGLVANHDHIYFSQIQDGKYVLAEMPFNGGPIRTIPTSLPNPIPEAISPDGKHLLVASMRGAEQEHELWMVNLDGTSSKRISNTLCRSAAWSPDGKSIAFSRGQSIFLTSINGTNVQELQRFAYIPRDLSWTKNGQQLQFVLEDPGNSQTSLWLMSLDGHDKSKISALTSLSQMTSDCCKEIQDISDVDSNGDFLLWDRHSIWFLKWIWRPWGRRIDPLKIGTELPGTSGAVFDSKSRKLVFLAAVNNQSELIRFNSKDGDYKPFLPGQSVRDIAFSHDEKKICYLSAEQDALWISNPDGSGREHVNLPQYQFELPRWSPDGSSIALMAKIPDRSWRILIVTLSTGKVKEASKGDDPQGAPTWSPDGKWISYGNVECEATRTCAIHRLSVATGEEQMILGSEGLSTARWSPNGRFIAALNVERRLVMLYDLEKEHWYKLADDVSGNDLGWASDSRYLYASLPLSTPPGILRIDISNGKVNRAADLAPMELLPGRIDTWFTLAPDNSLILNRWLFTSEIFSQQYTLE